MRQSRPNCLCIVETKISRALGVLYSLGFVDSLEVPSSGTRGGLIFAWCRGMDFDLVTIKQHLCSVVVFGDPSAQPWAMTLIRSPCDSRLKDDFWEEVGCLGSVFGRPWIILGDFNALSGPHEKWGAGLLAPPPQMGFLTFGSLTGWLMSRVLALNLRGLMAEAGTIIFESGSIKG